MLTQPQNPAFWKERHPNLKLGEMKYYDKVLTDMEAVPLAPNHWLPQSVWTHYPPDQGKCLPADPQPHVNQGSLLRAKLGK
jgi:hypothetical protein